jgi:hypothetical protein
MAESGGFTAGASMAGPSVAGDLAGFMVALCTTGSITGSATGASTPAAFEDSAEGFLAGWDGPTIHIRMNGHIPIDGLLSELRLRSRTIRSFAELVLLLRPGRLLPVRDPMHYRLAGGPSELTRSAPSAGPAAMSGLNDARCGSRGPQCGGEDLQALNQFRPATRCTEANSNRLR